MRGVSDSDGYSSRLTDLKKWDVFPHNFPAGEYSNELTAETRWQQLDLVKIFSCLRRNKIRTRPMAFAKEKPVCAGALKTRLLAEGPHMTHECFDLLLG